MIDILSPILAATPFVLTVNAVPHPQVFLVAPGKASTALVAPGKASTALVAPGKASTALTARGKP